MSEPKRSRDEYQAARAMTVKNGFVPKDQIKKGMRVTCKTPVEAYGSDRDARKGTRIFFNPGDEGIVGAIDVPSVRIINPKDGDCFVCVDFGEPDSHSNQERCALHYNNIILLDDPDV